MQHRKYIYRIVNMQQKKHHLKMIKPGWLTRGSNNWKNKRSFLLTSIGHCYHVTPLFHFSKMLKTNHKQTILWPTRYKSKWFLIFLKYLCLTFMSHAYKDMGIEVWPSKDCPNIWKNSKKKKWTYLRERYTHIWYSFLSLSNIGCTYPCSPFSIFDKNVL